MINIKEIAYNNWPHCVEIINEKMRLIVTTDVGPRIIFCGARNSDFNLFFQYEDQQGKMNSGEWLHYGGHRLWHSPQAGYRPNQPDNAPVLYTIGDGSLVLKGTEEVATKVQKELVVKTNPATSGITMTHRIYNRGLWPIKFAPWALTMMAPGGTAILPIPKEDTQFMPNYAISFWPWTKPNDHRFVLGEAYMTLQHDSMDKRWFKIGYRNTEGWGAYLINGFLFVKLYSPIPGRDYPDYGSTFEVYTDNEFLELETLGPLTDLEPDAFAEHTEEWHVFTDVSFPLTEPEIYRKIAGSIKRLVQ